MNKLLEHVIATGAAEHLREYLDPAIGKLYAGRLFDKWARPGIPPFTFDDLVAVKALSVEVPAEAADALLDDVDGEFRRLIGDLESWTLVDDITNWRTPANELHRRLRELEGVGPVIAGKLMHAKLPTLIPIWDDRTQKGLQYPAGQYWESWHRDFTEEVRDRVSGIRASVPLAARLTDVRVLDIVIWRAHEHD